MIPPEQRVMEVGCVTGHILASLRPSDGLGIDLSPTMVALAAAKYPGLRFRVHNLMDEEIPERFDFVLAVDVAEHLPDLARPMASMAAGLAAGGSW